MARQEEKELMLDYGILEKKNVKEKDMNRLYEYRKFLRSNPNLKWLFIEVTDKCNLFCRHCGSSCKPGNKTFIDTKLIISTIRKIKEDFKDTNFNICLTGGEPMLHPDFWQIVEAINECGISWGMTTNGCLIDEQTAVKLKEYQMGSCSVSIDGMKENHEWLRRVNGSFDQAVSGIKYLINTGHPVQVTTTVNKKNITELDEVYEMLKDMSVPSWRIINTDPIGRSLLDEELLLNNSELKQLIEYIRAKRYSPDVKMDVCFGCSHYLSYEYEREVRDFYFQCGAGTTVASICCNGDIIACLDIERRSELVQGNICKDNFIDVWTNKFREFRTDRTDKCEKCRECPDRKFCGGDSTHTWDFDNNEPRLCMKEVIHAS